MTGVRIIAARRTPIGKLNGAHAHLPVEALAAPVLIATATDAGLVPEEVDEVVLGNAAGPGGNPARVALLEAGFPIGVPGVTVDRQCGSGLEAIWVAASRIASGEAEAVLAGGVESASTAPIRAHPSHDDGEEPRLYTRARFAPDRIGDPDMGVAAETVARRYGIGRMRQDAFALASHRNAAAHRDRGGFSAELVLLRPDPTGTVLAFDQSIRDDTSAEKLEALRPVFVEGGTVTAGNACPVSDGAAVAALVSDVKWRALGRPPSLRLLGIAAGAVDPNELGIGPVPATRRLLARPGMPDLDAIGRIEFNEAFAAQVLASVDLLSIDPGRVNPAGGALALGHPWGASGAVLVVRLYSDLVRSVSGAADTGPLGLALIGIGGGQGLAALFERG